jgi:hypothetical protein
MDLSVVFPEVSGGSQSRILADLPGMSKRSDKNAETPDPVPLVDPLTRSGADDSLTPPASHETRETGREIGGPPGPEPTRFGDWEKNGRCIDF